MVCAGDPDISDVLDDLKGVPGTHSTTAFSLDIYARLQGSQGIILNDEGLLMQIQGVGQELSNLFAHAQSAWYHYQMPCANRIEGLDCESDADLAMMSSTQSLKQGSRSETGGWWPFHHLTSRIGDNTRSSTPNSRQHGRPV